MQNAKEEVKKQMTDAEQKREEANELDKQARETLETAKQKHDEACELDKQAREKLETAKQKREEAGESDRQAKRKLDEVYKNSGNIETDKEVNAKRNFAQKYESLNSSALSNSFHITEDLINWTEQQEKDHKSQVDFKGYVVKVINHIKSNKQLGEI